MRTIGDIVLLDLSENGYTKIIFLRTVRIVSLTV